MSLAILNQEGVLFLLRWIHFLAGVTWIGLLYYFNFVQGEFFKEIDPGVKNVAISKLVPRALVWFRWGAMLTWLSGLAMITGTLHTGIPLKSAWGVLILLGGTLGTLMWVNVWFVIWPAQKVVIASTNQVLEGGKPLAEAADNAARSLCASRTNVVFSFPMLFFMGAARHLILGRDFSQINLKFLIVSIGVSLLLLEWNALRGKPGPMATVRGAIHCGVLLTVALYLLVEITTR